MQKITKREVAIIGTFICMMLLFLFSKYYMDDSKEFVLEYDNEQIDEIEAVKEVSTNSEKKIEIEEKWIIVDICGEVKNPGIVKVKEGDRVTDAVNLAGGLLETADRRQINMARVLLDGEQIYICKIGESVTIEKPIESIRGVINTTGKVNINTALRNELESLNGIGKVLAQRIIEYRNQNGRFQNINDIMKVSGVGEKKFKSIKEHISIN